MLKTLLNLLKPDFLKRMALKFIKDKLGIPFRLVSAAFLPLNAEWMPDLPEQERLQMIIDAPVLDTDHDDWPLFFKYVPRSWTTWRVPFPPPKLAGNARLVKWRNTDHVFSKPIPEPQEYFAAQGYIAFTTKGGIHGRLGARFDDVDNYLTFPAFTLKDITP